MAIYKLNTKNKYEGKVTYSDTNKKRGLKKIELLEFELKKKLMQLNTYNYMKSQDFEEKEERRRKSR